MSVLMLVIGIVLILLAVVATVISIIRTPDNLRGFYGVMYFILMAIAVVGGIVLIVLSFLV